jgi:hypothetical protein
MNNIKIFSSQNDGYAEHLVNESIKLDVQNDIKEIQQLREYDIIKHLICSLSLMCAASPNKVTDLLTGYLWDKEESELIKKALVKEEY